MLVGLGPLLGEGELGASVYPDGARRPFWYRAGQGGFGEYVQLRVAVPRRLAAPDSPLAVLLGPGTASSAEVLATALVGRPNTRSFGAPTSGLSAGNRTFELEDGAALVLTVAATADRAGRVAVGPIVPDDPVDATNALPARGAVAPSAGEDRVLAAATAWLEAHDACRDAARPQRVSVAE
jgi:C-terminal processing protease CtpA/Prc